MCRLLCLLALWQKSVAACQEAGVAPAPPFDSLQEEHLKAIKTQNTKEGRALSAPRAAFPLLAVVVAWPKVLRWED